MRNELPQRRLPGDRHRRRAIFTVVACSCLVASIAFAALSVDVGLIAMTKVRMQNAADAAALAAAQEITNVVQAGGTAGMTPSQMQATIESAARAMAAKVAGLNGIYVNPTRDVDFGQRTYNKTTGKFTITWGVSPFNVVRVSPKKTSNSPTAPDAKLNLFFASFFGKNSQELTVRASAYVDARDLVLVLDYSGSMNDDSTFSGIDKLGLSAVQSNMLDIYNTLGLSYAGLKNSPVYHTRTRTASGSVSVTATFKGLEVELSSALTMSRVIVRTSNGSRTYYPNSKSVTYSSGGYYPIEEVEVTSNSRTVTITDSVSNVKSFLGLSNAAYPFPYGSWDDFISTSRSNSGQWNAGYGWMYGKTTFVNYLLESREKHIETPKLCLTPHYPFHAMKNGVTLFCTFLSELSFGDSVGLVTYDTTSRVETGLSSTSLYPAVSLGSKLITDDYAAINTIQRYKQAGHYDATTAIGAGLADAYNLLKTHGRYGAKPTILLMTDGQANQYPNGWDMPNNFNWSGLTDYNGDGKADYTTTDTAKAYAFYQAKLAIDAGYQIHTMSVGAGADRDLMKAIAFAGGGEYIDVPGGTSIAEMETQLRAAFTRIAANVPPPRLMVDSTN